MNVRKIDTFWLEYAGALMDDVCDRPKEYALRAGDTAVDYADRVAIKLRAAVEHHKPPTFASVNYRESRALHKAAKAAGVPFTRIGLDSIYSEAV